MMLVPAWDFHADDWLHARMALMRSVEGGYAMVRAAAGGLVTVSDARGRVIARDGSERDAYASVIADVPMGTGRTPYLRIGDAFAWLAGAAGLLVSAVECCARRRYGAARAAVTRRGVSALPTAFALPRRSGPDTPPGRTSFAPSTSRTPREPGKILAR
jgi:apolipoprotein N-acyltransferase